MIEKILKYLKVLQIVSNDERHEKGLKRLGRGYSEAHRINRYNPLSYIIIIIAAVIVIILFGFVGLFEQIIINPFKWD